MHLLCKGQSVYHGSAQEMLPYFTEQGYYCEAHDNPADFVLDTLIDASQKSEDLEKLNQAHWKSLTYRDINALAEQQPNGKTREKFRRLRKGGPARSLGFEIYYVSKRTATNAFRNPALLMSQGVVATILGLLIGFVFRDMKRIIDPGIQNRLGAIFFMVTTQIFSTVTAIEPLIKERALFIHVSRCYADTVVKECFF